MESNSIIKGNAKTLSFESDRISIKGTGKLGEINALKPYGYRDRRKRDWQSWGVGPFKDTPDTPSGKLSVTKR